MHYTLLIIFRVGDNQTPSEYTDGRDSLSIVNRWKIVFIIRRLYFRHDLFSVFFAFITGRTVISFIKDCPTIRAVFLIN